MKKFIIILIILIIILIIGYYLTNNNTTKKENNTNQNISNVLEIVENTTEINQNTDESLPQENISEGDEEMPTLNIKIGNSNFTATLYDNETTRELLNQMPLSIIMNELNGNEKYYYLNQKIPTNSQKISKIEAGDLMLFGSDCLVLFYDSFSTSYSYTKLGKIDNPSGLAEAVGKGNVQITFNI